MINNVFILPQTKLRNWVNHIPCILDLIRKNNIKKVACSNEENLNFLKNFYKLKCLDIRIEFDLISTSGAFSWTSTWLKGAVCCLRYLDSLASINEVFYLSQGGDVFYALDAKNIDFKFSNVSFNLLNVEERTIESKLYFNEYPQDIHDVALSDVEDYIYNNSDNKINLQPIYTKVNLLSVKKYLILTKTLSDTTSTMILKALKNIKPGEDVYFDIVCCELVEDDYEILNELDIKNKNCKVNFMSIEKLLLSSKFEKYDLVITAIDVLMPLASFLFEFTPSVLLNFSPLSKNRTGYKTLSALNNLFTIEAEIELEIFSQDFFSEKKTRSNNFSQIKKDQLVSVCITHYERPQHLKVALQSIICQSYKNIEIIISDDGSSSDESLHFLNQLSSQGFMGKTIKVLFGDNNYLGHSRNKVRDVANGTYIFYMDDDNLAMSNEIENLVKVAERNNADFVGSFMKVFHSNEPLPNLDCCDEIWAGLGDVHSGYYLENYFSDANGLYRKASLDALGGYSTDYGLGYEDWELFHRMKLSGMKIIVIPEPFYFYRVNIDNSMVKTVSDKESLLRVLRHSSSRDSLVKDLLISGRIRTFPY